MDKIKNVIKRHKGLAIIGSLSLVLLIIIFAIFARMIFSGENSTYGDRLNNLVKISKSTTNEIIEETKNFEEVEDITIRIQGKIIYTTIYFTEKTSKDKAKEIANKTLEKYEEEIIDNYDFEYFLTQKTDAEEDENKKPYIIAGTKHPDNEKISWTKN